MVFHSHGNEENVFDRFDYVFSSKDALHINAGFSRSWFQTPNSYDNLNIGVVGPNGTFVGPTDQRSKILTFNIAPTWTHTAGTSAVFTVGGFVRRDAYNYYPSDDPSLILVQRTFNGRPLPSNVRLPMPAHSRM